MTSAAMLDDLTTRLGLLGLRLRGGFPLVQDLDRDLLAQAPAARTLLLVGNVGSEMWRRSGADIRALAGPDPLDRWTRREIEPIAGAFGGVAVFPFGGPPYWPFQRWAQRAEGVAPSPLGILIHPTFGLWHAYRAAIALPVALDLPAPKAEIGAAAHPCAACADRPCLSACPVDAFAGTGYEVDRCVGHVARTRSQPEGCLGRGCLARLACPVGADWRYAPEHAAFHMEAFLAARLAVL